MKAPTHPPRILHASDALVQWSALKCGSFVKEALSRGAFEVWLVHVDAEKSGPSGTHWETSKARYPRPQLKAGNHGGL